MAEYIKGKANILGCYVDIQDINETLQQIDLLNKSAKTAQVITLNAEIAYQAMHDEDLKGIINSAELVTPDGIGIVWASRVLGYDIRERITGIDLIYELCACALHKDWSVFFLGAAPGIASTAGDALGNIYPGLKIVGSRDGFFKAEETEDVIAAINEANPDLLFVALGAPKQEYWINKNKNRLDNMICIGVGGSFDVIAGKKKRAPDIFVKLNLEWFYRLLMEPARIKRQISLPLFVLRILKEKYFRKFIKR